MFNILPETTLHIKIIWNTICIFLGGKLYVIDTHHSLVRTLYIQTMPANLRIMYYSLDNRFLSCYSSEI